MHLSRFFSFVICCLLISCSVHNKSSFKPAITIAGELANCDQDTVWLYKHDGIALVPSYSTLIEKSDSKQSFILDLPKLEKGFYFLGTAPSSVVPVILGDETKIRFKTDCREFKKKGSFLESTDNASYRKSSDEMGKLQREFGNIMRQYGRTKDPAQVKSMTNRLGQIDRARLRMLDTLQTTDPFMAKVLALNAYQSYQHNKENAEQGEIEYFAKNYFKLVDLQDADYNRIPQLFDSFKGYAYSLASAGLPQEVLHGYLDTLLNSVPENTTTSKMALAGIVFGLESKDPSSFVKYGRKYVEKYPTENPEITSSLQQKIDRSNSFIVGAMAPEINEKTPEGTMMKLSDLRGKVVLIDFWASWCGPCRKVNPQVVALYNKYKDDGFEILGVSLDRNKDSWLKAIEKDGLEWYHVSDLKQWKSLPAQTYGVSSIPQTVLVDKEGKILARNLKGKALEDKLEELLK